MPSESPAGSIGAALALKGDRYLHPRSWVRHRTRPNLFEPNRLVSACGLSAQESNWLGTGAQEEYERLAGMPLCRNCTRCLLADKPT